MLSERQLGLVVSSAMSKYAAKNDGKRGLAKKDVIYAVAKFGGDMNDIRAAMIEGIKRIAPDYHIFLS